MRAIDILDISAAPTPLGGMARILVDKPELKLVYLEIEPGKKVEEHEAGVDVTFVVLSGEGTCRTGDKSVFMREGMFFTCPAGVTRSFSCEDKGLALLVVRAPNI